jgi:hypothetical protein
MSIAPVQSNGELEYPATWRWDEHGHTLEGLYVRMEEGATDGYGRKPIVILNVDGQERSVWLFDAALVSKFRDQLATRPAGDFDVGERVAIERGAEKVKSATSDRRYWPYKVRFPDAPQRSAGDILGTRIDRAKPELPPDGSAVDADSDDPIPF